MPHFALQSTLTQGFLAIDGPPHKDALFARADQGVLSLSSAFALPRTGRGAIIARGTGSYLNICQKAEGQPYSLCAGTPSVMKPPRVTHPSKTAEHHRRLLLTPSASSEFVVEIVS
jgi:hypothetical protein